MAQLIEYLSYFVLGFGACLAVLHWVRRKVRPWGPMGFCGGGQAWADIGAGLLIPAAGISVLLLLYILLGLVRVAGFAPASDRFWWFVVFLLIAALIEEVLGRSLLVNGLRLVFRKNWMIILASSVFFGMAHLTGEGVTVTSVISNSLGGAIYTIAFMASGNLFFPWALHVSWNASLFICGFRVSGIEWRSIVLLESLRQNSLSGGEYGPESGLLSIVVRLAVLLLIGIHISRSRGRSLLDLLREWPKHVPLHNRAKHDDEA